MDRTINSAVVTGPTGAVGTALCSYLAEQGIEVYAAVRPESPRGAHLRSLPGVRVIPCDLRELERLPERVPCAEAWFHLAWAKTVGQGRYDMPAQIDNIRHTIAACRAAGEMGCKVFVGAGSQAEYGRFDGALTPETPCFPENGYGMAKLCAGQMSRVECERLGIRHVWARILSVYGPWDGAGSMISATIRRLLAGERPPLSPGTQLWDYLYAEDAAQGLYRMAVSGRDGMVYPLGSGNARPLGSYIRCLRDAIDPALPLGFGEIPFSPKQVMHLQADISALQRDTGFAPKVDFEAGIRKTIEWMKEQGNEFR